MTNKPATAVLALLGATPQTITEYIGLIKHINLHCKCTHRAVNTESSIARNIYYTSWINTCRNSGGFTSATCIVNKISSNSHIYNSTSPLDISQREQMTVVGNREWRPKGTAGIGGWR
jgi:hypothetical protein